jgi:hypothetical protein
MSRNDITGDEIKTKASSNAYRENYDIAFKKQSAYKWLDEIYGKNAQFVDTKGWTFDNTDLVKKISKSEFIDRCNKSQIQFNIDYTN